MNPAWKHTFAIVALATVASLVSAPHAHAAASTQTSHQSFTQTSLDVNQCSNTLVFSTISGDTTLHVTARPNNTVSMTVATTGTITLTPAVGDQPAYTGHLTDLFSGYGVVDPVSGDIVGGRTMTSVHTVILHGTDGSHILVHSVTHETINPDGTVAVSFDLGTYTCP